MGGGQTGLLTEAVSRSQEASSANINHRGGADQCQQEPNTERPSLAVRCWIQTQLSEVSRIDLMSAGSATALMVVSAAGYPPMRTAARSIRRSSLRWE